MEIFEKALDLSGQLVVTLLLPTVTSMYAISLQQSPLAKLAASTLAYGDYSCEPTYVKVDVCRRTTTCNCGLDAWLNEWCAYVGGSSKHSH